MKLPPPDTETDRAVGQLATGRTNAGGTVTLRTSQTTTTITDRAVQKGDYLVLFPLTADAASAWPYGEDGAATAGSYVLTHSSAGTTRKYRYIVTGD